MFGGVGKSAGWATILGTVGFVLSGSVSAKAADLGGNCCADLEERVAELEATTARKGNRKVSLTVSGWVNEQVLYWNDGTEQQRLRRHQRPGASRFRFVGEAKIDKDWSAGYVIEIGVQGVPSNQWNQLTNSSTSPYAINAVGGMVVRKSNWYIKSDRLGQISVGQNGTATYHLLDDADGANTRLYADAEAPAVAMAAFRLRHDGAFVGTLKWTDALRGFNNSTPGQDGRRRVVRYDSPTVAGFTVITSWGEDDLWDAALTYKGSWNGISVLARAGYGSSNDPGFASEGLANNSQNGTACGGNQPGRDPTPPATATTVVFGDYRCSWEGAAATIKHDPTGLYLYGGWGRQHFDNDFKVISVGPTGTGAVSTVTTVFDPTSTTWFIQPGIEEKWTHLGKTTIFGMYQHDQAGSNPGSTINSDIKFWQAGVVQNIEAAAMDFYLIYQHTDGDVTLSASPNTVTTLDAFQMVTFGALIQF